MIKFGVIFVDNRYNPGKMKIYKILSFSILLCLLSFACGKIEQLPDEPYIEFRSFKVFDTTDILGNDSKGGRLRFYFEDGDGDLGLDPPESVEEDSTNLFFDLYRKVNGIMVKVPANDVLNPSDYRIPYMQRTGQNKILRGTIDVTFLYLFYLKENTDTIRYDFYIKDRAGNISNTASTSEISLSDNNIYLPK
jgi:hypothetical protein